MLQKLGVGKDFIKNGKNVEKKIVKMVIEDACTNQGTKFLARAV